MELVDKIIEYKTTTDIDRKEDLEAELATKITDKNKIKVTTYFIRRNMVDIDRFIKQDDHTIFGFMDCINLGE